MESVYTGNLSRVWRAMATARRAWGRDPRETNGWDSHRGELELNLNKTQRHGLFWTTRKARKLIYFHFLDQSLRYEKCSKWMKTALEASVAVVGARPLR